ncbi:glycosyltransferase family A protein [Cylindrospermopsis raciborskii]|uniref:glycosyltransferase family 2 protein n=1 Tax=Cylindrospermopsis raciborskii TaxID=77022 RepID=UPI0022C48C75|nr:glycosyltransferase family A protein [Cylindrospermopsis raciborskii]MCZ2207330.1 glycosyltransferase family A protein [Cylindrospermopsis raciborskii PAMP2011]
MPSIQFDPKPEISVVLTTYNRSRYLKNCINSVTRQTFEDWELVIVDDGSTDDTFEIVSLYLAEHRNIRYLKHQNRQVGYARNAGIQASFGKYITFIDSDDTYKATHLESRLEFMRTHPEIDIIQGGFEMEGEFFVRDYFRPDKTISIRECVLCPTFFGKRNVYFQLSGFKNLACSEDTEFWQRAKKMFKTQDIKQPETYIYTRAKESLTRSLLEEMSPQKITKYQASEI